MPATLPTISTVLMHGAQREHARYEYYYCMIAYSEDADHPFRTNHPVMLVRFASSCSRVWLPPSSAGPMASYPPIQDLRRSSLPDPPQNRTIPASEAKKKSHLEESQMK